MKIWRYALRELSNNRQFCLLYIFNLCLGLTGFIALNEFSFSLDNAIKNRSRSVLGGDLGLSARRPLAETEIAIAEQSLGDNFQKAEVLEMFSMVATPQKKSILVQIKAIENGFPFYGQIELEKNGTVHASTQQNLHGQKKIWIYPELRDQLGVQIGDSLTIGASDFIIDDIVKTDPAAGISTSMAPRVFLNKDQLRDTQLVKKGTIAWSSVIYKLPGRANNDIKVLRDQIFKQLDSPDIKVFTHENASEQMSNIMIRLNDFLGLTSLVALFLAGIGSSFLFRSYFRRNLRSIAILMSLGIQRYTAYSYYLVQILALGFVSFLLACGLALTVVLGLVQLTHSFLPTDFTLSLSSFTFLIGFFVATVGSIALSLPTLIYIHRLSPALLLAEYSSEESRGSWTAILAAIPGLILFWAMAVGLSRSYYVGSLFSVIFLSSGILLAFIGIFLFTQAANFFTPRSVSLKLALRNLGRNSFSTAMCFVAIGLSALLLNLIPQLRSTLNAELRNPDTANLPSFFLFDIQDDQLDSFKNFLERESISGEHVSPMIIARLLKVNDQDFDKGSGANSEEFSREQENEMRFRNRGFNLTFRSQLSDSETLANGRDFSGTYSESSGKLPEISVEKRFADRLGLKMNDKLTFDIESIPIEGTIVNFRHVRWTSFQPNFFVQFQPGVLEMAPKTYIATLPKLSEERKAEIQNRLVNEFPNISMIDVSRLIESIGEILEQMALALTFMAVLCIVAGFVVIYSIANHQAHMQKWEIGLLKSLGASFVHIRRQFLWQFGLMSAFAIVIGASLSLVASLVFAKIVFNSVWSFNWEILVATIAIGTLITLLVTDLAIRKALTTRIRDLFTTMP